MQLCAEASGLGFVFMHDGIFKQGIQPLDFLNRFVSLWHRHSQTSHIFQPIVYQTCGKSAAKPARLSIGQFHKNATTASCINELHQKTRPFILPGSSPPKRAPCHILQYVTGTDRDPKEGQYNRLIFRPNLRVFRTGAKPLPRHQHLRKGLFYNGSVRCVPKVYTMLIQASTMPS